MGTRLMKSPSRHSEPRLTWLGESHMFISVPTTIWLLTVVCWVPGQVGRLKVRGGQGEQGRAAGRVGQTGAELVNAYHLLRSF